MEFQLCFGFHDNSLHFLAKRRKLKQICQILYNQDGFSNKTSQEDDVVKLSVIDQGSGIPSEIIEKLGTPFLTTKEHGTGLGLAICYSIAARHDAVINVSSDASGTIFFVTFSPTGNNKDRD